MKLEPNMYVRTNCGYICKIININDFREPSMKYGVEASYLKDIMFIEDDDILKASHNIIDLIEVGDYVNGEKVDYIDDCDGAMREYYYDYEDASIDVGHYFEEIKSIVTKEQFSSIEYRLGDDK